MLLLLSLLLFSAIGWLPHSVHLFHVQPLISLHIYSLLFLFLVTKSWRLCCAVLSSDTPCIFLNSYLYCLYYHFWRCIILLWCLLTLVMDFNIDSWPSQSKYNTESMHLFPVSKPTLQLHYVNERRRDLVCIIPITQGNIAEYYSYYSAVIHYSH